jgi:hypothetical protein
MVVPLVRYVEGSDQLEEPPGLAWGFLTPEQISPFH